VGRYHTHLGGEAHSPEQEHDVIEITTDADFKLRSDTPLVTRSPFVKGEMLLMKGEQFADGRTRIIVPQSTDDATVERMTAQLEAHSEHMKRMAKMIAAVESLTTHSSERESGA
jgi:hypothetical protein